MARGSILVRQAFLTETSSSLVLDSVRYYYLKKNYTYLVISPNNFNNFNQPQIHNNVENTYLPYILK